MFLSVPNEKDLIQNNGSEGTNITVTLLSSMRAKITGTATFHRVDIEPLPEEEEIEVTGYYDVGETTVTIYRADSVLIDGMTLGVEGTGNITLYGDDVIWVHSDGEALSVSSSKPPDSDD